MSVAEIGTVRRAASTTTARAPKRAARGEPYGSDEKNLDHAHLGVRRLQPRGPQLARYRFVVAAVDEHDQPVDASSGLPDQVIVAAVRRAETTDHQARRSVRRRDLVLHRP
jgi:hypothetical protein